ncbi:50S ribosomal protein L3 [Zancudomyces culisetae]|uniref:Large ribosomal subunit protein uL3m n=1 Tax=Zancudomyces culisetae TaxID=1213189 RepID=A0A1R1PVN2_ZANCU|nr:50S ribosomal protein L3 [Zancudomyces culisetae]|eukprot:OMH85035.1 50S ribosomal protein L3 [Zancudomyces culisetae]
MSGSLLAGINSGMLKFYKQAGYSTVVNAAKKDANNVTEATSIKHSYWTPESVRTGVIARKLGMTAMWDEWGIRVPLTVLQMEEVKVLDVIEDKKNKENCKIRIAGGGIVRNPERKLRKPDLGQFKKYGVEARQKIAEFKITKDAVLPVGTDIKAAHFVPGQLVDIIGTSKGKGFAGAMKRWGFKGGNASHGASLSHRSAGSTGSNQDPGRVFPGKKMAGHMGNQQVTVMELKVMKIDNLLNLVYVKGAVPGNKGGLVKIRDAIKKNKKDKFPDDVEHPPFPTFLTTESATVGDNAGDATKLPREIIAKTGGKDPLLLTNK